MNKKKTQNSDLRAFGCGDIQAVVKAASGLRAWALFVVAALAMFTFDGAAHAQTLRFKSPQDRVTVPVNFSGEITVTNQVTASGLGGNVVSLTVSGLPSGVTATLTDTNGNALNSTTGNTNLWINLTFTGVAEGVYTFSLNGSATDTNSQPVNNNLLFTLQSGFIWNGSTNVAADGAGTWSDSTKWAPSGNVPGIGDDAVFADPGSQTNSLINGVLAPNIVVSGNTTVGSLRFAQTNATFQTIQINPGMKLSVLGTNGFSLQRDFIADSGYGNMVNAISVTFVGTNGATLVVSNQSANFSVLDDTSGNNKLSTLDMSGLDNLSVNVSRVALGDYTAYPNYFNYSIQNNYNSIPRRFLPNVNFAKTNVIIATFADPYNYTNGINRRFSFSFLNTEQGGTSTMATILLGITNQFFLDSVNFIGANQQGIVRFNPSLRITTNIDLIGMTTNYVTNSMVAYFRGTNGGRMSVFSISDASGTNGANSNVKSTVDFGLGTLDVLADRFYIGRDRPRVNGGQNPNYQGTFFMGSGIVDVNTAILGFQEYSGQTNTTTFNGYCEGAVTVTNTGIFKVNDTLTLGYCTQTDPNGLGSGGNTTWGRLVALNGGTVIANTILVGVPAHTSMNNTIGITNAALILSNTVASSTQMLDQITFSTGSTLALNINGANSGSVIYATNFNIIGSNSLVIASIRNLNSLTIPLFTWVSGGAPSFTLINQSGDNVQTVLNGKEIDLQVITGAPKNLIWKGYSSANWDNATANWLDTGTGLHTNFSIGDNVTFDDTASAFNISLDSGANILPGSITMTNTSNTYIFNNGGGGNISGGAVLTKTGTGTLQMDGPSTIAVQLNQGTLTGSGSFGSATIASGAVMDFSGNASGSVTCAGVATLELSANVSGALTLQSGGVVTNLGTINGSFTTAGSSLLVNGLSGKFPTFGSSTVVSNAIVINRGQLGDPSGSPSGVNLTVNGGGIFEDTGEGSITLNGLFTVSAKGTFIPGGDGIGTTTVYRGAGNPTFPGRILLAQGSTNIFKVNNDNGTYTKLGSAFQDLGPSASVQAYNGCTIEIINIGVAPFAAGQSFTFFVNSDNSDLPPIGTTGSATNTYPVINPLAPASGLAWNINGITLNGTVSIVGVSTNPFALGFMPMVTNGFVSITSYTTNTMTSVITTNFSTNNLIISKLSWPATNTGWRLQQQQTALTNGLGTNWIDVFGAPWTNGFTITNNILTNGNAGFFRMIYP